MEEEKVIRVFESKLERLKDITELRESQEVNLLIEYWREIVVKGLNEREKLLKDMLKDKEEKVRVLDVQANLVKMEVEQLENKNAELKNDIEMQKLMLEKEKVVLEYSYKDRYEEKIRNLHDVFKDKEIHLEKLKIEKENLERNLKEKTDQLKLKENEYTTYKQSMENAIERKEGHIEELEKTKNDLEETIDLIASSRINMWAREEKARRELEQQEGYVPPPVYQQPVMPQPVIQQPVYQQPVPQQPTGADYQQIAVLEEKLKAKDKEIEEAKERIEIEKKAVIGEYEQKMKEAVAEASAGADEGVREKILGALKQREEDYRESLEVLARGFVHKIRNVFGIVSGATQLCQVEMEECKEDPAKYAKKLKDQKQDVAGEMLENLETIATNVEEAGKDANSFLRVARVPALNMQPESLNEIIDSVCMNVGEQFKASNIKVSKKLDDKIPMFSMDKKFLEEAFYEIIANSIESMTKGGNIKIETNFNEKDKNAEVVIEDTGVGVPEQRLTKIFQIFCTSKKERKGIGLAVAKRFVEIHLGSLILESVKDKGTKVTVKFPLIIENESEGEGG